MNEFRLEFWDKNLQCSVNMYITITEKSDHYNVHIFKQFGRSDRRDKGMSYSYPKNEGKTILHFLNGLFEHDLRKMKSKGWVH